MAAECTVLGDNIAAELRGILHTVLQNLVRFAVENGGPGDMERQYRLLSWFCSSEALGIMQWFASPASIGVYTCICSLDPKGLIGAKDGLGDKVLHISSLSPVTEAIN